MNVQEDTKKHTELVAMFLSEFTRELDARGKAHDASKFESPEKEMFEIWKPRLDTLDIQSDEYKAALVGMGDALKHHYAANRHHPEHFENGIAGMNLIDLVEMICDWRAAAARTGKAVDMDWASKRFGIEKDSLLYRIVANTVGEWSVK
jgi:hypothetical protein